MGKRDIGRREAKKPKKDAKKVTTTASIMTPPATVEVIKKGKKEKPGEG